MATFLLLVDAEMARCNGARMRCIVAGVEAIPVAVCAMLVNKIDLQLAECCCLSN